MPDKTSLPTDQLDLLLLPAPWDEGWEGTEDERDESENGDVVPKNTEGGR